MSDQEPDTDPTMLPSNPATNPETVVGSRAPRAVTATSAGESGADELTQVRPSEPTGRDAPSGLPNGSHYVVSHEIARGGMGTVYAAHDPFFDREIALKVMHPGQDAERFVVEAQLTARLPHPGIPPVYALGKRPDGRPFLAMKLIKGDTLATLLKSRTDPSANRGRFVVAFEQVCQAVGYAHAQGIIHRDLKPANIMIGAFGEVQVMDWGLAKVIGTADATVVGAGGSFSEDAAATVAGTVKGTPAYMAPEQARGEPVDVRADVFALGGILAVMLTGKPPFAGNDVLDTIIRAASAELDDIWSQLDDCCADKELVEVAKWCLSARAVDRPADGEAVAAALSVYRAGVDARLRQAEQERAAADATAAEALNTRREAEARADAERAKGEEQRKRRRVQLALAGVLVLVALGAGVATNLVLKKQADDQQAADKERADERFAAERTRQADLKAADDEAKQKQRQTRADALVQALESANTAEVPRVISDLTEFRDLTDVKLRELAGQPVNTKPGLHARLVLLADEPGRAAEVAAYLIACRPDELLTIRGFLVPHARAVGPGLWGVLTDTNADSGKRVRAACACAALEPGDARWRGVAPSVSEFVVKANPVEFVAWTAALEPVRGVLLPTLMARYPSAREQIRGGKLDESALAAAVSANDLTANLLARYAADRPAELTELALIADPRHYTLFAGSLNANKAAVVPVLKAELAKAVGADRENRPAPPDEALEVQGKRRGYAGAALLALGEAESVWPVFVFPKDGDPTARSYLQERLAGIGADPLGLMVRFEVEGDMSAKRALLIALGDFPLDKVPVAAREALAAKLLVLYRDDPDPGLHSAIDWLLRQKWGQAKELAAIDAELAREARGRVTARAVTGAAVPVGLPSGVVGPQLPAPQVAKGKDWFVNGEGQTFAVMRGPVEFTRGSPVTELGRGDDETPHQKRLGRTFAIGTKEVTNAEFRRFHPNHSWLKPYSPGEDTPAVGMEWYTVAEYCNWLSAREGIPEAQWCYEPNKDGVYGGGMRMKAGHLKLTGYRLPTESEWEFACRGGAVTARYHGRGERLLPRYGWFTKNSDERAWPVGQLRPSERGLFDVLGNAFEWCEDPNVAVQTGQLEDVEDARLLLADERMSRLLRGGSFNDLSVHLRCAYRFNRRPENRNSTYGFRPVRTLLN